MRFALHLFLSVAFLTTLPVFAEEAPKKKYKIIYLTQSKGFVHGSVNRKTAGLLSPSELAFTQVGKESGLFDVECTQDASIITPEKLKDTDMLFFYTTGDLPISDANMTAMLDWLKSGKAFGGAHSATDTLKKSKSYLELINGNFDGHPWGSGTTVTITNHEPAHPAVKMFEPEFTFKDEIYQYNSYDPKAVRVLLSLNMEKTNPKRPYHVPVAWVREVGQGRLFYTNLGHNEQTWTNPKFQEHLLMGIRWALKLEQGPATPNPELQAEEEVKAAKAVLPSMKPALAELATAGGGDADKLFASLEKWSQEDKPGFKNLINQLDRVKGEKNAEKKKDAQTKLIAEISKK